MPDLQAFIQQAWTDHGDDAAGVAMRLPQVLDSVTTEAELLALGRLAHHVYGEHLGAYADGLKYLAALARGPAFDVHGGSGQSVRRWRASLGLSGGDGDARNTLDASERIAVTALAASNLGLRDTARATQLLREAVAAADAALLPDQDPAVRTLAVVGHGLAATLGELPERSADMRALMLEGAEVSRRFWVRAGTWVEVERADYRLAMCWVAAGDPAQARRHALACLALVDAQAEPAPLETFFGQEALGHAERAAGNTDGVNQAVAAMRVAFDQLSPDDQAWCKASLDRLAA